MVAEMPVVEEVKIGGGKAIVERYARFAVGRDLGWCNGGVWTAMRTNRGVLEDDEKTGVVLPLDLKASIDVLVVRERSLDVLRLELLWKASEVEDASDRRRKASK